MTDFNAEWKLDRNRDRGSDEALGQKPPRRMETEFTGEQIFDLVAITLDRIDTHRRPNTFRHEIHPRRILSPIYSTLSKNIN